jgi:hypothetical protein
MAAQRGAAAQGGPAATEPLPAGVTPAADAKRLLSASGEMETEEEKRIQRQFGFTSGFDT